MNIKKIIKEIEEDAKREEKDRLKSAIKALVKGKKEADHRGGQQEFQDLVYRAHRCASIISPSNDPSEEAATETAIALIEEIEGIDEGMKDRVRKALKRD
jgi:hypothetical protein